MNILVSLRSLISFGGKATKYVITERVLTFLTRIVDALMIYFIWADPVYGVIKAFLICTPINFVLCCIVVYLNDIFVKNGHDFTGIEEFREMAYETYHKRQYVKRFASWTLKRRRTIFLVGSCFYIDPDYVTLLLRDKEKGFWNNSLKITLPSVLLAMTVWTPVYWCAHKGYIWATWLTL